MIFFQKCLIIELVWETDKFLHIRRILGLDFLDCACLWKGSPLSFPFPLGFGPLSGRRLPTASRVGYIIMLMIRLRLCRGLFFAGLAWTCGQQTAHLRWADRAARRTSAEMPIRSGTMSRWETGRRYDIIRRGSISLNRS